MLIVKSRLLRHEAEAVIQCYRYGKDTSEAARTMGINKRSFSHYLSTGIRKLRECATENNSNSAIIRRGRM